MTFHMRYNGSAINIVSAENGSGEVKAMNTELLFSMI